MYAFQFIITSVLFSVAGSFLLDNIQTIHLYVSPTGSDTNNGRDTAHPIKTLHEAVSHLNDVDIQNHNVVINLMSGYHDLASTLKIHHSASRKVTFQAYNNEEVHVTGGKRLPTNGFSLVSDQRILTRLPTSAHGNVMEFNLTSFGITNLGHLSSYGTRIKKTAPLEVFFNGIPMRLARWPNDAFVNVESVVDGQNGRRFKYEGDRPNRWASEDDLWAYGYWYWSWSDQAIKIQNIATSSRTITLTTPTKFGLRTGHYGSHSAYLAGYSSQGGYYRIINALAELDQPGEYYVDRTSGILYFWPPSANGRVNGNDVVYVSLIDDCVSIEKNSANIIFNGFTIEACRFHGIRAIYATNITIQEMEIKNTGYYNFECSRECTGINVQSCYLHDGDGGVLIKGGDRNTLSPSNNVVGDNIIWRFSREAANGANAIEIAGVGGHLHHNHIYIGQYTGIRWDGNDHVIEYNHIHDTCMNATDCGAVHTGGDWTYRGNIIRKNHIHHTLRYTLGADVRGIMLDDQYSSALIDSNVFYDNEVHVNIGGGRDNIIRNNIFYNATKNSMQVDSRGTKHEKDQAMYKDLYAVPYTSSIWATRYPELAAIKREHPEQPMGNQIYHNIFYDTQGQEIRGIVFNTGWFNVSHNGHASDPSQFNSRENADFRPRCLLSSIAAYAHFPDPVQVSEIGPRYQVGPLYIGLKRKTTTHVTVSSSPCTTKAPVSTKPKGSYLPDGSGTNTLYNVSNHGCWVHMEKCPLHPDRVSNNLVRDTDGEQNSKAGVSEAACLGRVPHFVLLCGKGSYFSVIYGPTGAMTVGGDGCFQADFGCPKHNVTSSGRLFHNRYAETHLHAGTNEDACLSRAKAQYVYCGTTPKNPVTSIFGPTGRLVTAGGGCWIKLQKCPSHPQLGSFFYDSWGASNLATDQSSFACFDRAEYYWAYCGSHQNYPVTAFFRPDATSRIYP